MDLNEAAVKLAAAVEEGKHVCRTEGLCIPIDVEWQVRYGDYEECRWVVAEVLSTFCFLIDDRCLTTKEAVKKLRHIRNVRKQAMKILRGECNLDIPLTTCQDCTQPYERFLKVCPYCGVEKAPPAGRKKPEQVEGECNGQ